MHKTCFTSHSLFFSSFFSPFYVKFHFKKQIEEKLLLNERQTSTFLIRLNGKHSTHTFANEITPIIVLTLSLIPCCRALHVSNQDFFSL